MNYIPGFSNYLETTAPRYARGGPARFVGEDIYDGGYDGPPMTNAGGLSTNAGSNFGASEALKQKLAAEAMTNAGGLSTNAGSNFGASEALKQKLAAEAVAAMSAPRQAAVAPMTQEAAPAANAPLTLEELAAIVPPGRDPSQREQNIASQNLKATPYSINNYLEYGNGQGVAGGKPTTTGMYEGHNYTLVDNKTGTILAQGSTPEEIQKIQNIANGLSSTQGKNADWRLYDANPESGITNMHEKMPGAYLDLSTPGDPRGVVVAGNMPNNVFKDFIIPALTPLALAAGAYFGGGALLGQAAGGGAGAGLGATATGTGAGTAATGGLTASQMSALGAQLATKFGPAAAATAGGAASSLAPIVVTGGGATTGLGALPALAGGITATLPALTQLAMDPALAAGSGTGAGTGGSASATNPYDPIVVTGGGTTTGLEAIPALAGGITASLPALTELAMDPTLAQPATEDIVVTGNKAIPKTVVPDTLATVGSVAAGLPAITELAMDPTLAEPATEDIVVTGNKAVPKTVVPDVLTAIGPILPQLGIPQVPTPDPALTKKPLGVEDYLSLAGKAVGLLGNIGGGGNQDQTGTYTRGGGSLNPIFSAKLPSAGGLGAVGVNRTTRPMGDVDWLTYGTRPELNFYDYAARPNPAPITTPVPGNPAGPIMEERDPMAMAKGGRSTFAVNGPGTGRSDDIPAVLSDGEYVIDAETVALLGDGSSKAGAKKLDDLRVKVRKHKGQKLAKGRFSANAKKPEAYLSGGRI